MNKSQVTRLDGIVENRLGSVNNDKRRSTTSYHSSKSISFSICGTANNHSAAPQAGTLYMRLFFNICSNLLALSNAIIFEYTNKMSHVIWSQVIELVRKRWVSFVWLNNISPVTFEIKLLTNTFLNSTTALRLSKFVHFKNKILTFTLDPFRLNNFYIVHTFIHHSVADDEMDGFIFSFCVWDSEHHLH